MSSIRKTISMPSSLYARAEELRVQLAHPDLSSFVQQLIREEWERRHGAAPITPTASPKAMAAAIAEEALQSVARDSQKAKVSPKSKRV
jgi:hypothetical protein